MTYFAFLGLFLGIPILLLFGFLLWDRANGRFLPASFSNYAPHWVLLGHMGVAFVYTTPWDNYLVAARVWYYDPALVSGIVWGWVPIEEYTFFLVQPLLTGMWLLFWAKRPFFRPADSKTVANQGQRRRQIGLGSLSLLWIGAGIIFFVGWLPATYLALVLMWALPPILFQLWFGAHILYRYRRLITFSLATSTLYLAAADALAIQAGTWTINPIKSLNIFIGGVLPIEEFIFFFVTNILLCFGIILVLAPASQKRLLDLKTKWHSGKLIPYVNK